MTRSTITPADALAQAASLIEARRARHGDLRMEATDGAPDDGTGAPAAGEGTPPADETPEQAIERLTKALDESKAHSRKHEDRAKANKTAADELARIKASTATDAEKLAEAERIASEARTDLARYRVALDKKLPASLASLLTGTEEQMAEQADALLAFRGEQKPTPPKPDPSQGPKGDAGKATAAEEGRAEAQRRVAARAKKS